MPFVPFFGLVGLLHLYLAWRIAPALASSLGSAAAPLWWGLMLLSALLLPMSLMAKPAAQRLGRPQWADGLAWGGVLSMGLFSSLLVLTLLRELLLAGVALLSWWQPALLDSGTWSVRSGLAVPLLALATSVVGFWNARRTAAVKTVDVPLVGLPAGLVGFTIAQLSDIHVGPTIKRAYLQAIVDRVNGMQADMVAITGDLVDGSVLQLASHVQPLTGLRSTHGTYFVTGNHEYYSGGQDWVDELRRLGLTVLMNEHVVLQHGGSAVVVGGVADHTAHHFVPQHRSDAQAAMAGAPADAGVRLLLAHQPRSAPAAAAAGFQLQLSGHTHGGQFWPWNLFVPLQQPFVAGLHRLQQLWVYTSRGTGYWGPPKRFGAPSEITRLRLVPAV